MISKTLFAALWTATLFFSSCAEEKTVEQPKAEVGVPEDTKPMITSKDGTEMVLVPAGEFLMGSPEGEGNADEHPQHTVFLDAFYVETIPKQGQDLSRETEVASRKIILLSIKNRFIECPFCEMNLLNYSYSSAIEVSLSHEIHFTKGFSGDDKH